MSASIDARRSSCESFKRLDIELSRCVYARQSNASCRRCQQTCPVGATTRGLKCLVCKRVCPEGIDPHADGVAKALCTKCHDCADNCPARAIRFPWRSRQDAGSTDAVEY
jgi:ferredoxin